jgi:hypothetical protein
VALLTPTTPTDAPEITTPAATAVNDPPMLMRVAAEATAPNEHGERATQNRSSDALEIYRATRQTSKVPDMVVSIRNSDKGHAATQEIGAN